jgi:transcriptional regulator with XRE-family HTH domain
VSAVSTVLAFNLMWFGIPTSTNDINGLMSGSNGKMVMVDGLGEFLRRERELRHISLDDVAERTKISRRYLEAIEEERYDRLPGETFVRGFIRSYAQSVGLDPEDTLLIYNHSRMAHDEAPPRAEHLSPRRRAWNERFLLWLLVAGLLVVGGGLVSVIGFLDRPTLLRWVSAPRPETGNTRSPEMTLTITAESDTWLRVTVDEQESQDMVLRAGHAIKWIGRERFSLSIGNARATHLRLNGRELVIPQPTQSILRQYTISREILP